MARRRTRWFTAVLLPLLAALVAQGLILHVHVDSEVGQHLHREGQACPAAAATLEAECVACRSGSQHRTALLTSALVEVPSDGVSLPRLPVRGVQSIVSRLVRVAAPPRAPPA